VDPFSQLSQLQHNLQAMTKTVAGLENDMLEVLKENALVIVVSHDKRLLAISENIIYL